MYNLIQGIAMLLYVILLTFYGQKYGYSKKKSFLLGITAIAVDYTAILVLTWIENGFQSFGAQNAVRVFVFNPLIIYMLAKLFKVGYRTFCDFNAFPGMVWYGLGHLACLTEGCCSGVSYRPGTIWFKLAMFLTGTPMLPQQIMEAVGALAIGAILYAIGVKYKFKTKGYMYYIMMILYGSQRFLFEFLRDNEKIIRFGKMSVADGVLGLSSLSFWALAMLIEGAVLLAITVRHDKKHGRKKIAF